MLVERPIQDLSVDAVAAEAGISRTLLFHYFPTKNDFHEAVVDAACRRILRNTSPDAEAAGPEAVGQFVTRYLEQVDRRRDFYLALVFGSSPVSFGLERVETLRATMARRVMAAGELPEDAFPVVHAWTAYVEDRALRWSALPHGTRPPLADEADQCQRALRALLAA